MNAGCPEDVTRAFPPYPHHPPSVPRNIAGFVAVTVSFGVPNRTPCVQIYPFSIVKVLFRKLLRKDPGRPKFYFGEKGTPEEVRVTQAIHSRSVLGHQHP